MKVLLRKIHPTECKEFSLSLKGHVDYTKVLLSITRKLLVNGDCISEKECDVRKSAYLKLNIDKQKRVFVYLSANKYYSMEYPYNVNTSIDNNVLSVYTTTGIECTFKRISDAISILNSVKCNSIIDVYESRDEEDENVDIESYKMLESFWANEPSYIRYDYDEKNSNADIHPLHHLDVNMSKEGSYKIGLHGNLLPSSFEDILDKKTDCFYLAKKSSPQVDMLVKRNLRSNKKKKSRKGKRRR